MDRYEAIERIKTRFDKWALDDEDMKAIQTLIPELAESRDERIRKEMINYFYGCIQRNKKTGFRVEQIKSWIAYLEKQKEQKPDDQYVHGYYEGFSDSAKAYRPAEWSEEDDWKRKELIQYLKEKGDYRTVWMTWLKSLRPRTHWKPSEEQMIELRAAISGCSFDTKTLSSLEKDLKKLM